MIDHNYSVFFITYNNVYYIEYFLLFSIIKMNIYILYLEKYNIIHKNINCYFNNRCLSISNIIDNHQHFFILERYNIKYNKMNDDTILNHKHDNYEIILYKRIYISAF